MALYVLSSYSKHSDNFLHVVWVWYGLLNTAAASTVLVGVLHILCVKTVLQEILNRVTKRQLGISLLIISASYKGLLQIC